MTINADKFIVPDGAAGGGSQDMKSGQWGETVGVLTNGVIKMPTVDGNDGDVITTDGLGTLTLKPIPNSGSSPFRANTNTTAPPASGTVRWNTATQNLATKLFMSFTNANGTDIKAFLNLTVVVGSRILFQLQTDQGQFQNWDVTAVVDQGTYLEIDVTLLGDAGGNYGNNNNILAVFASGTSSASSFETISSGVGLQRVSVASRVIKLDASGGAFSVTLPAAATVSGLALVLKKTDASVNTITVDGFNAETIDGELTIKLSSQYESDLLISDGIGWLRI